jgi:hypothetical protein
VLTEKKVDEIGAILEHFLHQALNCFDQDWQFKVINSKSDKPA